MCVHCLIVRELRSGDAQERSWNDRALSCDLVAVFLVH